MKTLLMATDLSARSDRAFDRAVKVAQAHNAQLHVVHIVDEGLPAKIAEAQKEAAAENIREHLESLPKDVAATIKADVKSGKGSASIVKYAKKIGAELIVLGLHDASHESIFRGTTSEKIIRKGELPVLVVSERARNGYRRVLAAVDFSIHSRHAIAAALKLVPDGELHLVHAYEVPFAGFMYGADTTDRVKKETEKRLKDMMREEMKSSLAGLDLDVAKLKPVLRRGNVTQVLRKEVARVKPDLLVLGTHGRTGIAHAFLGSVAENMLENPPCDILAVKAW